MSTALEIDSALGEARLLHGLVDGQQESATEAAYFSILRKRPLEEGGKAGQQRSYSLSMLEQVVGATRGNPDVYISQSSFTHPRRKANLFKQTRACWVDLDLYNVGRTPDAQTVSDIVSHGQALGLPVPSSIIHSGRGAYLKWYLSDAVQAQHLPAWKSLQACLTAAYRSLAADPKSRDASRVFRLLQTINAKSGQQVHRLDGSGELYDFVTMCESVEALRQAEMPVQALAEGLTNGAQGLADVSPSAAVLAKAGASLFRQVIEGAARGDATALSLYSQLRQPIMLQMRSVQSLSWKRFLDLRDLAIARGGIAVGERDIHMFWMLNELAQARVVGTHNFASEVRELLKAFPRPDGYDPLHDGSMGSLLKRIELKEKGVKFLWRGQEVEPIYTPSNQLLITTFEITPQEMSGLRTLIDPRVKAERRRARLDQVHEGRAERRQARQGLQQAVAEAFALASQSAADGSGPSLERYNLSALAKTLGAERSGISRLWKKCLKDAGCVDVALKRAKVDSSRALQARREQRLAQVEQHALDLKQRLEQQRQALAEQEMQAKQRFEQTLASMAQKYGSRLQRESLNDSLGDPAVLGRWAEAKVAQLMQAQEDPAKESGDHVNTSNTQTSKDLLARRMAMLRAAQGLGAMPTDSQPHLPEQREQFPHPSQSLHPPEPSRASSPPPPSSMPGQQAGSATRSATVTAAERLRALSQRRGTFAPQPQHVGEVNLSPKRTPAPQRQVQSGASSDASAAERLRALSQSAQSLAPFQRESAQSDERAPLVDGGAKAPVTYPTPEEWPANDLPPGSRYSAQEWKAARQDEYGRPCEVMEIQLHNQSLLLQLPGAAPPEGAAEAKQVVYEGGRPVVRDTGLAGAHHGQINPMGAIVSKCFSDCLLVAEDAWPQFPGAAEAKFVHRDTVFRVIRPRCDYTDPSRMWRTRAQLNFSILPADHEDDQSGQGQDQAPPAHAC